MYKPSSIWTRNYVLLLIAYLGTFLVHFALFTNLPFYVKALGGSNTAAGLTTTIYTIASVFFKPVFGLLIDTCGRKIVMLAGAVIVIISAISLFFLHSLTGILALRAVNGIGFGALCTVIGTMIVDNLPKERLAEGIGYAGISLTVSTAVGPAAGAFLIQGIGYNACFIFVLVVSLLTLTSALALEYGDGPKKAAGTGHRHILDNMFEKTAWNPSWLLLIVALGYGSVSTFITTYGAERNIHHVSLFFIVYAVLALVSRIGTGRLSDRHGEGIVFVPALAALFCAYLVLAWAGSLPTVLLAGAFYGFGYGIALPTLNVILIKRCPEHKRGAATAMLYSAMDIGVGVGAVLWGSVSEWYGFSFVYVMAAGTVLISLILYYVLIGKKTGTS